LPGKGDIKEGAHDLVIGDLEERITYKLSCGGKKLVSLATVLDMKPEVLLLDEPTSGIDPATKHKIIDLLQSIDVSAIIIFHDIDFISHTTGVIYGMIDGRITQKRGEVTHSHTHTPGYGEMPHTHSDISG
jgi:cobalt/nickel transport system ATP-binding protein